MTTATLGEVARYINGFAFKSDDWGDDGVRIIRIQNLNDPTKPYNRTNRVVKDELRVRQGDLLVSWSASLGVYEWTHDEDAWLNQHIFRVVPDEGRVDRRYLKRALERVLAGLEAKTQGATMKHLTRGVFLNTEIPLPSIEEQRRIAAVLDAADALRAKRREALAKLDTLTQAIFIDMFGDAQHGVRYRRRPLGELAANENSKRVPVKLADREEMEGEYPYHGASGVIDYVDDYLFEGQRLLIAEDGANLLTRSSPVAFLAEGRYWVNNHAHVLADNGEANLVYLRSAILLMDLAPFVTGSAQPKLTRKNLDSIGVLAPPRRLQDEFAQRVSDAEQLRARCAVGQQLLNALFASVQQRAFRGEL